MGKSFVTFVLTSLLWIAVIFIGADLLHDKIVEDVKEEIVTELVEAFKQLKEEEKKETKTKSAKKKAPSASNNVVKQTKPKSQPKTETQPEEVSVDISSAIIGYWKAVEGNREDLEITKYGTIIQWEKNSYVELDERFDYTIEDEKIIIDHPIWKELSYRVVITSDGTDTWLEMYGERQFAGKYKKIK